MKIKMEKINTYLKKSITALLTIAIFISSINISTITLPVNEENIQKENDDINIDNNNTVNASDLILLRQILLGILSF